MDGLLIVLGCCLGQVRVDLLLKVVYGTVSYLTCFCIVDVLLIGTLTLEQNCGTDQYPITELGKRCQATCADYNGCNAVS